MSNLHLISYISPSHDKFHRAEIVSDSCDLFITFSISSTKTCKWKYGKKYPNVQVACRSCSRISGERKK